jgi:hypothetical protein
MLQASMAVRAVCAATLSGCWIPAMSSSYRTGFGVLGPDNPQTLTTRGNLARWRGEAGDAAGAAAAFDQLLEDFLRVRWWA